MRPSKQQPGCVDAYKRTTSMSTCRTQQGKSSITTCKSFMVEACGCIVDQHFSWSKFIKQAKLLANVSLYQPKD
jgi:hypothetical protein